MMNLPFFCRDGTASWVNPVKPALARAFALMVLATLAACASRAPEPTLYLLRSDPPPGVAVQAALARVAPASLPAWQLMLPVRVPTYLDRTTLLLPQGANGVRPSPTRRWAEPLASSVPRVLAQDLNLLRGEGSVWTAPLPPNLLVHGQLRVELLALDVAANGDAVVLKARWTTADAAAPGAVRQHLRSFTVPSATSGADDLVGAHRLALWQLAQAIASTLE